MEYKISIEFFGNSGFVNEIEDYYEIYFHQGQQKSLLCELTKAEFEIYKSVWGESDIVDCIVDKLKSISLFQLNESSPNSAVIIVAVMKLGISKFRIQLEKESDRIDKENSKGLLF